MCQSRRDVLLQGAYTMIVTGQAPLGMAPYPNLRPLSKKVSECLKDVSSRQRQFIALLPGRLKLSENVLR